MRIVCRGTLKAGAQNVSWKFTGLEYTMPATNPQLKVTMSDLRQQQLLQWAEQTLQQPLHIHPVSGDASFRRYFRVQGEHCRWIAMDAPPDKEDSRPFVAIARQLEAAQVHVPHIEALDLAHGFMLLEDFGDVSLLDALQADGESAAQQHYGDALRALLHMQCQVDGRQLPAYDRALLSREMTLFDDWLLGTHLRIELDASDREIIQQTAETLIANALEQPRVFVHRDYHSRNLMVIAPGAEAKPSPGIIDFQDAVYGPLSYDLVSLLRDCYIAWPEAQVAQWVADYHREAQQHGLCDCPLATFQRWFDLMGVQRHLKAMGIFARLKHRDGKPGYLHDIPRTLAYVEAVCGKYTALHDFAALLQRLCVRQRLEHSLNHSLAAAAAP